MNNEIEKRIHELYTYDSSNIIHELEKLYDETNNEGILYYLGEAYYFGQYHLQKDEEKAIEYLKKAANANYLKAIELLGFIYTAKAQDMLNEARIYYEQLSDDSIHSKFLLGSNLMADYLISPSGAQFVLYDQFYTGLGLVSESCQMGYRDANVVLNVLDKGEFIDNYEFKILESKNKFIHKLYSYNEDDLICVDEEIK